MHKTHKLKDHILLFLIYLSALFSVLVLVCIIGYVVIRGIRNVNLTFLTTVTSANRHCGKHCKYTLHCCSDIIDRNTDRNRICDLSE